jgi:putative ABC transport system permease protein
MIALALRSLGQRKLRTALTALAILLGVAMIAGTYVQADRIRDAFTSLTQTVNEGTDVVVSPRQAFDSTVGQATTGIDERLLARVRAVPGVKLAEGQLTDSGALVIGGEAVSTGFAPSVVSSWSPEPFDAFTYVEGGPPRRPGDVVVDRQLAEDEGLRVGQHVGLATRSGEQPVVIAGVGEWGGGMSLGGATLVVPQLADVQRWFQRPNDVSRIVIAAEPGVEPAELAAAVRSVLPRTVEVETGAADAAETADAANDAIGSFLTPALLALSGAALLVGAFIIFNTFSITVAQRSREFALLRSLGATRAQILMAVAIEALALGVAASVLGLFAGLGIAALLGALFDAALDLPSGGLVLSARTVVLSLTVGIVVTLLSAVVPAVRATRVPPVSALQTDPLTAASSRSRRAPFVAAGVSLLGLLGLLQGLFGGGPAATRLSGLAGGAVLLFVGVALVARYVVRPFAGAIGRPLAVAFDEPGRLARENAMRNPARTATTSAALMVGLALVVFVAVFAAGLKTSITGSLDELVRADIAVTAKGFQPLPPNAQEAIRFVPGVDTAMGQYMDQIQVNGKGANQTTDTLDGVEARLLLKLYKPKWLLGGSDALVGRLRGDTALIEEQFAETHGIAVGDRFSIQTPSGGKATLLAIGEYRDPQILQGIMVDLSTFQRVSALHDPFAFFVSTAPGWERADVQQRVGAALERFPTAEVRSNEQYRDLINQQVNQIVYLLYALLAMSLVISLFGIANSLFLAVHERTREFGLLRAVGATQRQVRRIVRYESVITAVIGALLGTAVGVLFAALATAALSDLGLGFALPAGQLAIFLVLAVVVGVVGAAVPARRAARVDVLDAMRHD